MTTESTAYRITKWWYRHSSAEQRRLNGRFILCPTSFDSLGYRKLVMTKRGVEAFGVYVSIAELAGKLPTAWNEETAGVLANDQGPLNNEMISILVAMPQKVVGAALNLLQARDIGWVARVPFSPTPTPGAVQVPAPAPDDSRESHGNCPGDSREHPEASRVRARLLQQQGFKQQHQQQPRARTAPLADGESRLLGRMRVPSAKRGLFAGYSGPQLVTLWASVAADASVRQPGAVMAARVEAEPGDPPPPPTLAAVQAAIKAGVLRTVNRVPVDGLRIRAGEFADGGVLHPPGIYAADGTLLCAAGDIDRLEVA